MFYEKRHQPSNRFTMSRKIKHLESQCSLTASIQTMQQQKAATALAIRFSVGLHKDTHTPSHIQTNIHAHILSMCKNRRLNTASI